MYWCIKPSSHKYIPVPTPSPWVQKPLVTNHGSYSTRTGDAEEQTAVSRNYFWFKLVLYLG